MARNNDIAFSELRFFKHKCARKTNKKEPANNQLLKAQEKRESNSQSPSNTEYFVFLNESQKHDHKFFGQLAEKEGEGGCNSQQMMFSMVNKVAKIFKRE